MRFAPYALAVCVALAVPVATHAETVFTYTPTGGSSITFTLDLSHPLEVNPGFAVDYGVTGSDDVDVAFFDPVAFNNGPGNFGPINFQYEDDRGFFAIYDGVKLYSGPETSPTFLLGTYDLEESSLFGGSVTGTLVIANVASTPEPSSFFLVGTGVLGFAGSVRRRVFKS